MNEKPFSCHVFLFPFKWRFKRDDSDNLIFSHIVDMPKADDAFNGSDWQHNKYEIQSEKDYNEYCYFYPFARKVLYDCQESAEETSIVKHYEYLPAKEGALEYIIALKGKKKYSLDIESIILNLYCTGIGILSFHLKNTKCIEWEDILSINEYGRRIYPQFLTDSKLDDNGNEKIIRFSAEGAKGVFLADTQCR